MRGPTLSQGLAWAFSLAPVALLALTWGEELSPLQRQTRTLAYPILAVEVATIVLSVHHGIKFRRPPDWIIAALLGLIGLAWGTAILADAADASITRTAVWTVHLVFGIAVAGLVTRGVIEPGDYPPAIAAGFVLFTLLLGAFVVSVHRPDYDWVRDIPAYSNIRWYGYYAAAVFGLCAFGFSRAQAGYWAVAVLAIGCALWTGSRGAAYAATFGYVAAAILMPSLWSSRRRFVAAVACGILLSAVLTLLVPIGPGIERLAFIGDPGRLELWRSSIQLITQRPFLGWREAQFGFLTPFENVHPHNVVLQIVVAWGVAGLLLIGVLGFWLSRAVLHRSLELAPLVLAVLTIAAFSFIDGTLYHVQSVATFVLCLSLLAGGNRMKPPSPEPQ